LKQRFPELHVVDLDNWRANDEAVFRSKEWKQLCVVSTRDTPHWRCLGIVENGDRSLDVCYTGSRQMAPDIKNFLEKAFSDDFLKKHKVFFNCKVPVDLGLESDHPKLAMACAAELCALVYLYFKNDIDHRKKIDTEEAARIAGKLRCFWEENNNVLP
jgi:hypothetical protein